MKILMEKQYSLKEACKLYSPYLTWDKIYSIEFGNFIVSALSDLSGLGYLLKASLIKFADLEEDTYVLKDYVSEMLGDFYVRYHDYFAVSIDDRELTRDDVIDFLCKFFNVLNVTYPKYSLIIKALKDNEAKLMHSLNRDYTDGGESSGTVTSRYNDTPQDGGAFDDDNHTTNINESASSSESSLEHKEEYNNEYMIDRINKIRDNLSNIFTEWENKVATILWR